MHLTTSLSYGRALSVRGALAVVFVNRYAVLGINLVSLMIVARLVTPAETGLFSIAGSIVLLAQAIRDFGIAEFLVQEKDLTPGKIRTAFGMNLILAWGLGLVIFLTRGLIADLYSAPELASLIAIVCGSFLVAPFSSTILALLNRRMEFITMLKISVASNIANGFVSIGLAYFGWGAMALSLGMLAMNVTTTFVTAFFMPSWEHFSPSLREWRKLASFGIYMSGTNIINQASGRIPELIVGRVLGFEDLGQFNRARGIVNLFYELIISSVHTVAFPAFSAAYRAGEDVRVPYLRATTLITGTVLPVLAVLSVTAKPLVRFMLGDQWLPAVPLMPILVLGTAVSSLAPIVGQVLSATGGIRLLLRSGFCIFVCQIVLVATFVSFGTIWLAISQALVGFAIFFINAHFLRKGIGVRIAELLRAAIPSVWTTLVSTVLPCAYVEWRSSTDDSALLTLLVAASLAAASWITAILVFRHPLGPELRALFSEAIGMLPRRRNK